MRHLLTATCVLGLSCGLAVGQENRLEAPDDVGTPDVRSGVTDPAEAATERGTTPARRRLARASDLMGRKMYGDDGRVIGKIADLVVDTRASEIAYVLVQPLDADKGYMVLPGVLADYSISATRTERRVRARVKNDRLTRGPVLSVDEYQRLDDSWTRKVDAYYADEIDVYYDTIDRDTEELNERARSIRERARRTEQRARDAVEGDGIRERVRERIEENREEADETFEASKERRPPVRSLDTLDELEDRR